MRPLAVLLLCAHAAVAAPRVRTIRTLQGVVITVRETPANPRRCRPAHLELSAKAPGQPAVSKRFDGECTERHGDDPGSFSTWRFKERLDVGGHTFVVLENDDAGYDHRSIDEWLYDFGCGAFFEVARLGLRAGFEVKSTDIGTQAGSVEAKGEAGARWKRLLADGYPLRWSEAQCRFEADSDDDE